MTVDHEMLPGETSPDVSLPLREDDPPDPHPIYDDLAARFVAPSEEHRTVRHAAHDTEVA